MKSERPPDSQTDSYLSNQQRVTRGIKNGEGEDEDNSHNESGAKREGQPVVKMNFSERQRLRNLKRYDYFVILPDDPFKKKWDMLIIAVLIFTALVSPYRIAFITVDTIPWVASETIVDITFSVDLILNFFFAYYDETEEVIDTRKDIAINYVKSWFLIDLATILPI